jgi:hypothetical protein
MNERIKELVKQATLPGYMLGESYVQSRLDEQKFAELIVGECMECADIVGKSNLTSGYPNSTAHHIKQKIREHFGVEE